MSELPPIPRRSKESELDHQRRVARWHTWRRQEPCVDLWYVDDTEVWLPVVGYEGLYEVSDWGRVRSVDRTIVDSIGRSRFWPGKVLSFKPHPGGRPVVGLTRGGRSKTALVHTLVAAAFIGPRPKGSEVRHWPDPDPTNNRPSNLQYGTKSENMLDSVEHGTHAHASQTHCKHGHEFTPDNTYMRAGSRNCRQCRRNRQRKGAGEQ